MEFTIETLSYEEEACLTTTALVRATYEVDEGDLSLMVPMKEELPVELQGLQTVRDELLDNDTIAAQGFPGRTGTQYGKAGRITGYVRQFATDPDVAGEGNIFLAGMVAHLFESPESVSQWMHGIFLSDFKDNVGKSIGPGMRLESAEELSAEGFYDESVALKAVHSGESSPVSSTVVDFRVGRILGVAYIGTVGDHERLALATDLGLLLEKHIVRVALDK